jgi:hypothetical protein
MVGLALMRMRIPYGKEILKDASFFLLAFGFEMSDEKKKPKAQSQNIVPVI